MINEYQVQLGDSCRFCANNWQRIINVADYVSKSLVVYVCNDCYATHGDYIKSYYSDTFELKGAL